MCSGLQLSCSVKKEGIRLYLCIVTSGLRGEKLSTVYSLAVCGAFVRLSIDTYPRPVTLCLYRFVVLV